jgi:hypothetical protein
MSPAAWKLRAIWVRVAEWARRLGNTLWWFFNTPVGVWLLTSGVVGIVVWQYHQWQQEIQPVTTQRLEMLNLEIAARLSQFGTWARGNLLSNQAHEFKPEIILYC